MTRYKINFIICGISFILLFLFNISCAENQSQGYSSSMMIIKFKDHSSLGDLVEDLFTKNQNFGLLTGDSYLDRLNKKYQLIKVSMLFKGINSMEEIKKKFPERSKRIPANAKIPNLGFTYKFEFNKSDIDILKVAEEYEKDFNVEYAQPDYSAIIHNEK